MKVLVLQASPRAKGNSAWMANEFQRMYCVNKPKKVKKMALLCSSYSPGVYDGAISEYKDICDYWAVADCGIVTADNQEQKTEQTSNKISQVIERL